MQSFIMNSHEEFIHIHLGCFAGTGAIVRLPQCQWSKPDGYGKISQCITITKHSKAKTLCIFLGIYCSPSTGLSDDNTEFFMLSKWCFNEGNRKNTYNPDFGFKCPSLSQNSPERVNWTLKNNIYIYVYIYNIITAALSHHNMDNFSFFSEHMLRIKFMSTFCEISHRWMPQNTSDDKSIGWG